MGVEENLMTFIPKFDVFSFPDHCAEGVLGFHPQKTRNVLDLRERVQIPLAGIVRANDTVEWWPDATSIIRKGDQGLVMRVPEFSSAANEIVAITLAKLERLND